MTFSLAADKQGLQDLGWCQGVLLAAGDRSRERLQARAVARIERMFSAHAVLYLSQRYKQHAIRCVEQ